MAIIQGNAKQGSTRGFYPKVINGSLRFNDDDSAYLSWTPASAGNQKTFTISFWLKMGLIPTSASMNILGTGTNNTEDFMVGISYDAGRSCRLMVISRQSSSVVAQVETSSQFRDPSAWYHFVISVDTTQATPSNRIKIYVNGVHQTSLNIATYPTQNLNFRFNSANVHRIGTTRDDQTTSSTLDGYLANVHFIDGQALTASDFGETKNGVWVAKDYAGTFGTNGFYLTFEDDTQVEAFNTVLYRGTGSELSVTGTGFTPDLVWCKRRDSTPSHSLQDSVRGPRGRLFSDTTAAEDQNSGVISFDSDGFTIDGTKNATGSNGSSYVAWCWDAGANNAVTGHSSVTYTGNGGTQKISGFPFSPDLVWIKQRNVNNENTLQNTVTGATKGLISNSTGAEFTIAEGLKSFDSDGFVVGSNVNWNQSGGTYVAWAWDAGDGDPVSNTAGSITSTVKASQANGFSIVSYTGTLANATVGHGLSSAPTFMIIRDRDNVNDWAVWHTDIGTDKLLKLNSTGASLTNTGFWNNTAPTSSVIHLGTTNLTNNSGNNIGYIWHDVTGKQKFGTYSGTGASGNTVTTGFRPGWLMVKRTDTAEEWVVYDSSRSPFNPNQLTLNPNRSDAEGSYSHLQVQFDSNGFTLLSTDSWLNASGGTYIYAAFAGSYSDYITDYNTDGSIDSRVKANQTTGFSICSFNSGASGTRSFGHGLGTTPSLCIFKERNSGGAGDHWVVWEGMTGNPATSYGYLNLTNAFGTDTSQWSNTAPTSTEFTFNSGYAWSTNQDMIAYCWSETTGYSKFGSYTGGTDGYSVTGLGFKPAWVLIKPSAGGTGGWRIYDNTRDVANPTTKVLIADNSNAEADSSNSIDIDADGFTLNGTSTAHNGSGYTYIYAAFADTREAAFWLDQSGNDNDWQPVNLDHNDTVVDSPTNNFATLNPLNSSASATLSDGNLKHYNTANDQASTATFAISSGKWYWEVTTDDGAEIGLIPVNQSLAGLSTVGAGSYAQLAVITNGTTMRTPAWATTNTTGLSAQTGTFGVVVDADAGKMWVTDGSGNYVNSGNPTTGANPQATFDADWLAQTGGGVVPYALLATGIGAEMVFNFGQQPFKYDPPA